MAYAHSRRLAARPAPPLHEATLEFPGCEAFHLPRSRLDRHEGRLEFWDGETETAWAVKEPAGPIHESPPQILSRLLDVIEINRGSVIYRYGSADLRLCDERGQLLRIMQADQTVYLHPSRARLPGEYVFVGETDYPDVVLEVDHTTDIRRGKLKLYKSWGFPELWLEVPERGSPSRPKGVQAGLRIYQLEEAGERGAGAYRESGESGAFPGWMTEEIHRALNEAEFSPETVAVLERIGRALGEREARSRTTIRRRVPCAGKAYERWRAGCCERAWRPRSSPKLPACRRPRWNACVPRRRVDLTVFSRHA